MPAPDDLALLVEAARAAGEMALSHWRRAPAAWDKGDGQGPVSEADLMVDALLARTLRAARPDYGWLSEETDDDPARLGADRVFLVDPIDGTRSYLDGRETWAVSIAVARAGRVETGVVALPARNRVYSARAGSGAWLDGARLEASRREVVAGARVLAPKSALSPATWGAAPVPPVARHFRPSLAYRLCLVAEGRFDAMVTYRDAWEWDIAAGALIAAEAGARVTDRRGGPLRFNAPSAAAPGVVAAAPALHAALLDPRQPP